jgi:hypothetical protein
MKQQTSTPNIEENYLHMPYNRYLWLRKEFMLICDDDAMEAMIMRVIEYEIEGDRRVWLRKTTELIEHGKPAPEEPEWWIALSHRQIMARLYDAIKNEKTIRAKLNSLVNEKKFLLVRANPDNIHGSPQYTINKKLVQEKLDALPSLPSLQEVAQSQANPLPKSVPPTKSGTPYQSRQGGDTKSSRGEIPKLVPPPYQNREDPPTKVGTPYKKETKERHSKKTQKKEGDHATSQFLSSHQSISLSLDEQQIFDWLKELKEELQQEMTIVIPPSIGAITKTHLGKLVDARISTKGKLQVLCQYTKEHPCGADPRVFIGNLVNRLEDWAKTCIQNEPKTDEIETCETEPVPPTVSRPQRRRTAMIPGIANDLAEQIMTTMPDAHVEIRSWNGALQRVYLANGDEWVEFANPREWREWHAEQMQVAV